MDKPTELPDHLYNIASRYAEHIRSAAEELVEQCGRLPIPGVPPDDQQAVDACICMAAGAMLAEKASAKNT